MADLPSSEEVRVLTRQSRYGRIARVYEFGARLGSGGQIQASKKYHLDHLPAQSRVLYPGVGWGTEAAEAALRGHAVSVVELDKLMMGKAQEGEHYSFLDVRDGLTAPRT